MVSGRDTAQPAGVLARLASALGRGDEKPNQELAADLAAGGSADEIAVLAHALATATKPIRHDAIKVLYEIGALRPELIAPHVAAFLAALKSRDNRIVWGTLTALDTLATTVPDVITTHLPDILDSADRGSVIAKDKAVSMLATLAVNGNSFAWQRLLAILRTSADNQTPMYAEQALRAAPVQDASILAEVVRMRADAIPQPAKRARLDKVLRRLDSLIAK
ncbi:hypothetical protein CYK37_22025 [Mesorhizobium loti]|nr:hypothetical protein [Mesorhizobium loti]PLP56931.1 hypothetical protein CYK37_22025 [Mesorhizobium loti]